MLNDYLRLICEIFSVYLIQPSSKSSKQCHFILLRKKEYVFISKFAIASFLKFNPDYRVIVHCDSLVEIYARKLQYLFPRSRLSVVVDQPSQGFVYSIKGNFLLRLQGSFDIFLDADTRCNGRLPEIVKPMTLVAEFPYYSNRKWAAILRECGLEENIRFFLLNVSAVSWAGCHYGVSPEDFADWEKKWFAIDWSNILREDQIPYFQRFVEQVFVSNIFQRGPIQTLKDADFVADKGIIESSYFGATGYRFGR
jgi:hypothetical protein